MGTINLELRMESCSLREPRRYTAPECFSCIEGEGGARARVRVRARVRAKVRARARRKGEGGAQGRG